MSLIPPSAPNLNEVQKGFQDILRITEMLFEVLQMFENN